ncbi:hypothetical protein MSG28_009541 [Choristoneura fumiferana]|uniref:Uncharacterized protein n=1 Tax=Choristoneura fumiferana TaxID=7141 RepID=A0ACC0JBI9_CHOFU|nr:hypothetical protein MSG28_009541 [Choristoneura fumiferana]
MPITVKKTLHPKLSGLYLPKTVIAKTEPAKQVQAPVIPKQPLTFATPTAAPVNTRSVLKDLLQNKQTNQASVFGTPTQTTQASVFGTPPATQASVFGSSAQITQASVFGSPAQTSVFGAPATTASGSLFGGGESLFASVNISTTSAPSQSSESIFGGGFGSPTSSGFGASAFGGFNKSPGGFGTSATFGGAAFGGSGFGGGSPGSVFGGAAAQPTLEGISWSDEVQSAK